MVYKDAFIFVSLLGAGLFVVSVSNLITGKELEISMHTEKFVIIWIPIALVLYTWFLFKSRFEFYKLSYYKKNLISIFFILSSIISGYFFVHGFAINSIIHTDTISAQAYAEPLDWLNENAPKESVIWSNGAISSYIPTQTTDFQLFNPLGGLHLMLGGELEERYLVAHYFDNLTLFDIKNDFRQYAGAGNSIHQYKTYNRKVKICQTLLLSHFGFDCGQTTDAISFRGEKYFEDLYGQYKNDIKPNIKDELKKFKVSYVMKDKERDKWTAPNFLKSVWSNDRFEIFIVR
jgi:hypothetical protein